MMSGITLIWDIGYVGHGAVFFERKPGRWAPSAAPSPVRKPFWWYKLTIPSHGWCMKKHCFTHITSQTIENTIHDIITQEIS